jgi:hypothetical protein
LVLSSSENSPFIGFLRPEGLSAYFPVAKKPQQSMATLRAFAGVFSPAGSTYSSLARSMAMFDDKGRA